MQTKITLTDTTDPLKDMGHVIVIDDQITAIPWYLDGKIIGFTKPNDMTPDNDVYAFREGWLENDIKGLTPIFSNSDGMYQYPNIIVSSVIKEG